MMLRNVGTPACLPQAGWSPPRLTDGRPRSPMTARAGVGRSRFAAARWPTRRPHRTFPWCLGIEAAGVVVAVGTDVEGFAEGDEVMGTTAPGQGSYAEHAVLLAQTTAHKPPQVSFVQAAALPVAGGTAWDALEKLSVTEAETLLINGVGGGVGVMAAQLARNRGAAVFGVGSETKRSLTESLGATLVPYDRGDVVEQMRQLLPGGVDAIFDLVGGEPMRHVAILITNPARIVSVADPGVAELGGRFLQASSAGVPAVAKLVATGKVDPKVLQTYPFDEAPRHYAPWSPVTRSARS